LVAGSASGANDAGSIAKGFWINLSLSIRARGATPLDAFYRRLIGHTVTDFKASSMRTCRKECIGVLSQAKLPSKKLSDPRYPTLGKLQNFKQKACF
jgi:hypothetical protein